MKKIGVRALRENEEHYRDLVESSLDLICTHDLSGLLLSVNLAAAQTLGYEPSELVGKNLRELLSPRVHEELDAYLAAVRIGQLASGIIELWAKSGEVRIWEYTSTLRADGVEAPFVRAMAHDITEIVRAQKALRESEERLRFAAQVGRMYAWEWDPQTDGVLRSAECASILGLVVSPREDSAKNYFERVHPEDRSKLWKLATSLTPENPEYRTEYRRYRPDGALIWLEESGRGTFDKTGKMIRLIGMTADVTERKSSDEALHRKGVALTEAERLAGVGSWQWDASTDIVNWSEGLYRLAGRDPKLPAPSRREQLGLLYSPESYEQEERATREAMQDGKPYKLELELVRPDLTTKWVISRGEPLRNAEGEIIGLRGTLQDITERKLAEEAFASVGRRLIEAQEQERTRIARELHDDICQRLVLLAVVLDQLQYEPADLPQEVRNRLGELWKQTSEIASDLQSLSHELHSAKLEFLGVAAAMKGFCKEFAREQKVEIEFHSHDLPSPLSPDISLCLFRVLQEALHNSSKHSGVRHFDVQLWGTSGEIHLKIGDSGKGFDRETVKKSPGLGLISMEERLRLLNGSFSIDSQPKRGTTIHARVPLARVAQTTA